MHKAYIHILCAYICIRHTYIFCTYIHTHTQAEPAAHDPFANLKSMHTYIHTYTHTQAEPAAHDPFANLGGGLKKK